MTARAFFFEVVDDAMAAADPVPICAGDLVLVDPDEVPAPGDIVLAEIDNEPVVRILAVDNGRPVLRATSPAYPDITAPTLIEGVVIERRRVMR
jgi:SOS-response transcriptional repressor LexA